VSEARGLGRDAFIYALTSIVNAAAGFGSMYIFSRLLSPSEYGYYFAVLAGVEITAQLSTAWVNLTTIRLYASFGVGERKFFLGRVIASYAISFSILLFIALILSALTGVIGWHSASPWLIFAS
jgi:O-antigen/teichoic acid export membrane protein